MTTALVTLIGCNHSILYSSPYPRVGDTVYCLKCSKGRVVKDAPAEWNTRCRGCSFSRSYGAAKLNAERAAVKHHQKCPHHTVLIRNGRDVVVTLKAQRETLPDVTQVTQSNLLTDPPF
jgi:hypothetical protein